MSAEQSVATGRLLEVSQVGIPGPSSRPDSCRNEHSRAQDDRKKPDYAQRPSAEIRVDAPTRVDALPIFSHAILPSAASRLQLTPGRRRTHPKWRCTLPSAPRTPSI